MSALVASVCLCSAELHAADATTRSTADAGADNVDAAASPDAGEPSVTEIQDAGARGYTKDASVEEEGTALALPPLTVDETRPAPVPKSERRGLAVQTIAGLIVMLVLAYVANHPRVRRVEDLLGLRSVITTGFPFVALGMIARHPAVGVLTDDVLSELKPVVEFGLGWLGFLAGFRLDLRSLDSVPRGTGATVVLSTAIPFFTIAAACGAALVVLGFDYREALFLRSAVVLSTAGAMMAPTALKAVLNIREGDSAAQYLDEMMGVIGLALLAAYFRPSDVVAQWALPGTAWLFVTLGMGTTLGILLYVALRRPATQAEFMAIALGSVAFAAGMAAYVNLSPLVICFVAGAFVANLPSLHQKTLGRTLHFLERPIFLVFLSMAGALWDPRDVRGWVLVPIFVASRYMGLWVSYVIARRSHADALARVRPPSPLIAPISVVAMAVVINASDLYKGPTVSLMLTAVIGGALVTEVVSALAERAASKEAG